MTQVLMRAAGVSIVSLLVVVSMVRTTTISSSLVAAEPEIAVRFLRILPALKLLSPARMAIPERPCIPISSQ